MADDTGIQSLEDAQSVARLLKEGKITGAGRDRALADLRAFDARQAAPAAKTAGAASGATAAPTQRLTPDQASSEAYRRVMDVVPGGSLGEAALSQISGGIGALGGGLNYLATLGGTRDPQAAEAVRSSTQEALTYQPRTALGQAGAQVAGKAGELAIERPSEFLGEGTRRLASAAGASPEVAGAAGAAVKTGYQAIPYAAGARFGGRGAAADTAAARAGAEGTARDFVSRTLGLDWDRLSTGIKDTLTRIAQSGTDLSKLDPKAVERVARAQSHDVPVPITRAQATRNLADISEEEALRLSKAGQPLRDIQSGQDTALHGSLAAVRERVAPGSKVATSADVGPSVQTAARRKLQVLKAQSTRLYQEAREAGDLQAPVSTDAIGEWLQDPANRANAGWVRARLKAYDQHPKTGPTLPGEAEGHPIVSINNLERIRQEANAKVAEGGTAGHYAGELKKVIDGILDQSGGERYQAARRSWREWNEEFRGQKAVRDLTSEKANLTDRRIALEGTTDYILKADRESLQGIKKTLLEGGTEKTRARGAKAWKDLQAGVIQRLREEAAGKRGILNEADQQQFNSSFLERFTELDRSGKLEVLFGKEEAGKLRSIAETVRDVRTTPAQRIAGSNTVPRLLGAIEMIVHHGGGTIAKLGKGVLEKVKEGARVEKATRDPLAEAGGTAARSERKARRAQYRRTLAERYGLGSVAEGERRGEQ